MTIPYFFINKNNINNGFAVIESENFKHLVKALRARIGDTVEFSDNEAYRYVGKICEKNNNFAKIKIEEKKKIKKRIPQIILFQSILKKEAMELVLQKTAEIGLDSIVPVVSKRVVGQINEKKTDSKINRWQSISLSACMQSKRDFVCVVEKPINLIDIRFDNYDKFFILYERNLNLKHLYGCSEFSKIFLKENFLNLKKVAYLVGPEGGFDNDEIQFLNSGKAILLNFGQNILRAETASIYFLSIFDFLMQYYNLYKFV